MQSGPSAFFFWICLCQHLELSAAYNASFLIPTNLTWKILHCKLHVYWECNVPWEIQDNVTYEVTMTNSCLGSQIDTTRDRNMTFDLYPNAKFMVTTIVKGTQERYESEEISVIPEGLNGTAAENVSVSLSFDFNISMTFLWNYGKNAPDDTVYKVFLRQTNGERTCEIYRYKQRRMAKCIIPNLNIRVSEQTCIIIEGSSKEKIQMLVRCVKPSEKENISPPSNIRLNFTQKDMLINWIKPSMVSDPGDHCFTYMIKLDENESGLLSEYSYTVPKDSLKEDSKLKIRAIGKEMCGLQNEWSKWSESIPCGTGYVNEKRDKELIPAIAAGSVLLAIIVLVLLWCKWLQEKILPPIPKPKLHIDFETCTALNGSGQNIGIL
uniref:Type I cytokine receptor cytokine-binding domain-containing protein n=1 Tax=Leptobrachium leishanense TaxID=445787 RepID=A0A8C5LZI4_9ANUR